MLRKSSKQAYTIFRSTYPFVPSETTLGVFLQELPLSPGRNGFIYNALAEKSEILPEVDKLVFLVMDEMWLHANLYYDRRLGKIVGVEDFGVEADDVSTRTPKIANHANFILLRTLANGLRLPL